MLFMMAVAFSVELLVLGGIFLLRRRRPDLERPVVPRSFGGEDAERLFRPAHAVDLQYHGARRRVEAVLGGVHPDEAVVDEEVGLAVDVLPEILTIEAVLLIRQYYHLKGFGSTSKTPIMVPDQNYN